ncbi:MAG: anaerobic ribonucleoside-triphosphate reductase activating protein [Promethearchaeota archaeon]
MQAYVAGKPLLSTTDWPSKVSCVIFFVGCNLRCRFCFNGPLLEFLDQYKIELERLYPELEPNQYLIDGVIATGGEPTLQPAPLKALAEWTKQNGLEFGLMTNGTKPDVVQELLEANLVDYIAVDLKTVPDQTQYANVTQSTGAILAQINETINLLKSSKISYEFRTTLVPSLIDTLEQLDLIRQWVGSKHYVLQQFRPARTVLDSSLTRAFTPDELTRIAQYAQQHKIITRF